MKEKEEVPEKELNEIKASNFSEKKLIVVVIRMLKHLGEKFTSICKNKRKLRMI